MAEVYAVETVLALKSNVLEQVGKMIAEFEKLGELIKRTGLMFDKMTGRVEAATVATERMAKAQAAIAAESAKTAESYRVIAGSANHAVTKSRGDSGGGMVAGGIAAAGIFTGYHAVKTEMDNQRELAKFRNDKSISDADAAALRAKAEEMTRAAPGSTIVENLGILLDTFTVIRDVGKSMAVGVDLAKVQAARRMMGGADTGSYSAAKFAETLQMIYGPDHQVSANEMRNVILREQKIETAFAGRVTPDMLLAFAKQARTSGMMVDPDFIFEDLPAIIQAVGGQRAGTGLASFSRQFTGGTMTKVKMEALQKAGLIDKNAKWSHGHVADMDQHLIGGGEASKNPESWVNDFLIPVLKRNGIDVNDKNAVAKWIMANGSTNTGAGFLAELVIGRENIAKDRDAIRDKTTDDPLATLTKNAPATAALLSFNSALNEFLSVIGKEITPQATAALQSLTAGLNSVTDYLKANPQAGHDLVMIGEDVTAFLGLMTGVKMLKFAAGLLKLGEAASIFAEGGKAAGGLAALATGLSDLVYPLTAVMAVITAAKHGFDIGRGHEDEGAKGENGYTIDPMTGATIRPGGAPIHKDSYLSGPDNRPRIQTIVYTTLDGKVLAKTVSEEQARSMSLPASGSTRFDLKMTPQFAGTTIRV